MKIINHPTAKQISGGSAKRLLMLKFKGWSLIRKFPTKKLNSIVKGQKSAASKAFETVFFRFVIIWWKIFISFMRHSFVHILNSFF